VCLQNVQKPEFDSANNSSQCLADWTQLAVINEYSTQLVLHSIAPGTSRVTTQALPARRHLHADLLQEVADMSNGRVREYALSEKAVI